MHWGVLPMELALRASVLAHTPDYFRLLVTAVPLMELMNLNFCHVLRFSYN